MGTQESELIGQRVGQQAHLGGLEALLAERRHGGGEGGVQARQDGGEVGRGGAERCALCCEGAPAEPVQYLQQG